MPGVPEKFLTEKCVGKDKTCPTKITVEQSIACFGLCEPCYQDYLDSQLKIAETPTTLKRLVEDLEEAEREENRDNRLDPEDQDGWDR